MTIMARIEDPQGVSITGYFDRNHQHYADLLVSLSGWSGGVGVRRTELERLSHGSFPTPTLRTGRTMTVDLMLERDTLQELLALERGLSGLWSEGGYGSITVENEGEVLSTEVTLDGEPKITVFADGGYLTVQLPLWSPMPYLYGPWRQSELRPVEAGVGLVYPMFSTPLGADVLTFGSEVVSDAYVWNDGNAPAYPVVEVRADAPGGFRVDIGAGYLVWPRPTYRNIPVTVDFSGFVQVGKSRQTHLASARKWAPIDPGSMALPTFELLQGGYGYASIRHRDTSI